MQETFMRLKREIKTHFLTGTTWWQARQLDRSVPRQPVAILLGDSRARSWPAPDIHGLRFFNRGIGYETSMRLLQRLDRHITPLRPALVIMQIGVNDFQPLMLQPERLKPVVAQCQESIRQTVDLLQQRNCPVLLTTIFPVAREGKNDQHGGNQSSGYWGIDQEDVQSVIASAVASTNAFIRTLGRDGVRIFDAQQLLCGDDGYTRPQYALDALHLNQAGYQVLNHALETHEKQGCIRVSERND